jgi:hypothetical protein
VGNTKNLSTAIAPWGARVREQLGSAPTASRHGSGVLPAAVAGYARVAPVTVFALAGAPMTHAAARKDDARVPDPRGRQR